MRVISIKISAKLNALYENGKIDADERKKIASIQKEALSKNDLQYFIDGIIRLKRSSLCADDTYDSILSVIQ